METNNNFKHPQTAKEFATAIQNEMQKLDKRLPTNSFDGLRYMFDTTDLLEKLDIELNRQPADLVVIDAFGDLYNGRMNEATLVRTFLSDYHNLAQRHKCLVLFLHHTG